MRLRIELDDDLMNEALTIGQHKTVKDAVEAGLKLLVRRKKQKTIRKLRGKLNWSGNLEEMRTNLAYLG